MMSSSILGIKKIIQKSNRSCYKSLDVEPKATLMGYPSCFIFIKIFLFLPAIRKGTTQKIVNSSYKLSKSDFFLFSPNLKTSLVFHSVVLIVPKF